MLSYFIILLAFSNMYLGYTNAQLDQEISGSKEKLTIKSKEYRNERIWAAIVILQVIIVALDKTGYRSIELFFQIASLGLMVKILINELALKRKKDN